MRELLDMLTPAELRAAETFVKCQSRAETAKTLGLSPTTVRRLLQNAKRRLLDEMEPRQREYWVRPINPPRSVRLCSLTDIVNV